MPFEKIYKSEEAPVTTQMACEASPVAVHAGSPLARIKSKMEVHVPVQKAVEVSPAAVYARRPLVRANAKLRSFHCSHIYIWMLDNVSLAFII